MKTQKFLLILTIAIFSGTIVLHAQDEKANYKDDTTSVQNILDAYYDCISGPIGEKRDFNRFKNLFHSSASFTYSYWNKEQTKASTMVFKTVDEFIEKLDNLDKKGFYEYEIANTINEFGSVVQVFSTYTFKVEDKSIESKTGITSYEILFDGERYWIFSMFWTIESERFKIPEKYLKQ
jgi:hypothetical protein